MGRREGGVPAAARRLVWALAALALLALGLAAWRGPLPRPDASLALWPTLAVAFVLLERSAIRLRWRGRRITTSFTEAVALLTLLTLPPIGVLVVPLAGQIATCVLARRPLLKATFNASQNTLAAAAGVFAATLATGAGAPPILAAAVGASLYSLTSDWLVALLFARLDDESAFRVYRERLLAGNIIAGSIGVAMGVVVAALWRLHPLVILAAAPLLGLLVHYSRLQSRADGELELRRRLANDQQALIGCADEEAAARQVLLTAADVLDAGRVRLRLGAATWSHEPDAPRGDAAAPLSTPLVGRAGAQLGELEAWERPGKPRFGSAEAQLLRVVGAQAAHAVETARALAEVAAQRDLLARQDRMSTLGTLVAGVAHEVNNPLTYLGGNLDLAIGDLRELRTHFAATGEPLPVDLEETTRALETASLGAEHIAHIVRSLRTVARQRQVGARGPVSLNDVASNVATLLGVGIPPQVVLSLEPCEGDARAIASSPDLHQAVLNLAKNAVEALGERGGTVRLRVERDATHARLLVQDDGPGIPTEVLQRIRDPFFTTKRDGTGLGLPIVDGIAQDHGGSLEIDTGPGRGATFGLRLPLATPQARRTPVETQDRPT